MSAAVNDLDLDVTPDHVMVLRNAGPIGGPGMPEWGMLPLPKKLLKQGVRDMLRISDARMSGTSYGACILHVSPEAHIGGPLAAVRNGDLITVDVAKRVDPRRMSTMPRSPTRLKTWTPPPRNYPRGYNRLFAAACAAGARRLRLRLPRRRGRHSRAGDPLGRVLINSECATERPAGRDGDSLTEFTPPAQPGSADALSEKICRDPRREVPETGSPATARWSRPA